MLLFGYQRCIKTLHRRNAGISYRGIANRAVRSKNIKNKGSAGGGGGWLQNKQNVLPAVCPFLPVSQQPCWPPCSSGGDNSRI